MKFFSLNIGLPKFRKRKLTIDTEAAAVQLEQRLSDLKNQLETLDEAAKKPMPSFLNNTRFPE